MKQKAIGIKLLNFGNLNSISTVLSVPTGTGHFNFSMDSEAIL